MPHGGVLKEAGRMPKYQVPVFPVFRHRYNTDTEPIVFKRFGIAYRYRNPGISVRYRILNAETHIPSDMLPDASKAGKCGV